MGGGGDRGRELEQLRCLFHKNLADSREEKERGRAGHRERSREG